MKKLLSAIAVTSMLLGSTAAVAHDNYRHGDRGADRTVCVERWGSEVTTKTYDLAMNLVAEQGGTP